MKTRVVEGEAVGGSGATGAMRAPEEHVTVVPSLRRRDVCHKFPIMTRVPAAERRDYGNAVQL